MEPNIQAQIKQYDSYLQQWCAGYEDYAKSVGLSYTSLSVLEAIHAQPDCTQKQLCQACFLPKQTVNAVVTSFYKKGWVRLEEVPTDRRNKTIHFTEQGRAEAQRILSRVQESGRAAMAALSEEERWMLLSATERYVACCNQVLKGETK